MSTENNKSLIREAVGIFFDAQSVKKTAADLQSCGFTQAELGLLAKRFSNQEALHQLMQQFDQRRDTSEGPNTAFVVEQAQGDTKRVLRGTLMLATGAVGGGMVIAAAAVFGGAMAAAVATILAVICVFTALLIFINRPDADYLENQIQDGHLLLFVRAKDEKSEKLAIDVLKRNGAHNPKIYSVKQHSGANDQQ